MRDALQQYLSNQRSIAPIYERRPYVNLEGLLVTKYLPTIEVTHVPMYVRLSAAFTNNGV